MFMPSVESLEARNPTVDELLTLRLDALKSDVLSSVLSTDYFDELNEWQQETIQKLHDNLQPAQTVDLPTRTGKSHLIRALASKCQEQGIRSVITAPRTHILREHKEGLDELQTPTALRNPRLPWNTGDHVTLFSTQSIARYELIRHDVSDDVDVVFVDEAHRALGEKTVEGMRKLYPNAVFIVFTATPDFAEDRSVSDEYGEKVISHSVVEAIKEGRVPPVRAFLYKTEGQIDYLDPAASDFTPRELKRLANFTARNRSIVDNAHDLIADGRQGLVTTIPGEDLLHADMLAEELRQRTVMRTDGLERHITAYVMRGSDHDVAAKLQDYDDGAIDALFYCDLLREGTTLPKASFLINGRPTTSIVNLTQDIGRILQPKDGEMIVVDYLDESLKQQRTVYDVLELDRNIAGLFVGPPRVVGTEEEEHISRDNYMRGLFRPELVEALQRYNNQLVTELRYAPEPLTPYERSRVRFEAEQATELEKQIRKWERVLKKAGLPPEPDPDLFQTKDTTVGRELIADREYESDEDTQPLYMLYRYMSSAARESAWQGIEQQPIILPTLPLAPDQIVSLHPTDRVSMQEDQEIPASVIELDLKHVIETAVHQLSDREKQVLQYRNGDLWGAEPLNLDEVGEKFNLTRERIRQIEARAMSILRITLGDIFDGYSDSRNFAQFNLPFKRYWYDEKNRQDRSYDVRKYSTNPPHIKNADPTDRIETQSRPDLTVNPETYAANRILMRHRQEYFKSLKTKIIPMIVGNKALYLEEADEAVTVLGQHLGINVSDFARLNLFVDLVQDAVTPHKLHQLHKDIKAARGSYYYRDNDEKNKAIWNLHKTLSEVSHVLLEHNKRYKRSDKSN
jgi:superfamily II DNA or RNA helicase